MGDFRLEIAASYFFYNWLSTAYNVFPSYFIFQFTFCYLFFIRVAMAEIHLTEENVQSARQEKEPIIVNNWKSTRRMMIAQIFLQNDKWEIFLGCVNHTFIKCV